MTDRPFELDNLIAVAAATAFTIFKIEEKDRMWKKLYKFLGDD